MKKSCKSNIIIKLSCPLIYSISHNGLIQVETIVATSLDTNPVATQEPAFSHNVNIQVILLTMRIRGITHSYIHVAWWEQIMDTKKTEKNIFIFQILCMTKMSRFLGLKLLFAQEMFCYCHTS